MITVDVHIHTNFSHANDTVQAMYASAQSKGITVFGFSEHSPRPDGYAYPVDYQEKLRAALPDYIAQIRSLQQATAHDAGTMQVLLGLEMDVIPAQLEFSRTLSTYAPFDYIIGGIHFLDHWGFDYTATDWDGLTTAQRYAYYAHYFSTFTGMCQSGLYQIAAHPDIIKLFSNDSFSDWLHTSKARTLVRTALQALKQADMAMEVSSAGLRKPCQEIYPGPIFMELAAELAIPISFGSDAHCCNTVAYSFTELAGYAAQFGYAESVFFKAKRMQRQPF